MLDELVLFVASPRSQADFYIRNFQFQLISEGSDGSCTVGYSKCVPVTSGPRRDINLCFKKCKATTTHVSGVGGGSGTEEGASEQKSERYWKIGIGVPNVDLAVQYLKEKNGVQCSTPAQFKDIG